MSRSADTSLRPHLAQAPDFSQSSDTPAFLVFFLIISALALLKGRGDRFGGAANSGAQKQAMLAHHLALPHGPPSAAVIRRVFQHLAAVAFRAAILNLVC